MSEPAPARRGRLRGVLKWLTWIVALYAAAGFLLAPYLLRNQLLDFISNDLQREGAVIEVKINPFDLSLNIWGFRIDEPDGAPLLGFNELHIDFTLASLLNRAWTFEEFRLARPYVNVVVEADGALNLLKLGDNLASEPTPDAAPESRPVPLVFHDIDITDGAVHYRDHTHPASYAASLAPLNLKLDGFSTVPEREGRYGFTAFLGDGGHLRWSGNVALAPLRSSGRLEISGLQVATLWRYIRHQVNFIADEGTLGLRGTYTLEIRPDDAFVTIDGASLKLAGFAIKQAAETPPLFSLPLLEAAGVSIRWPEQRAAIDTIRLNGSVLRATLDPQGTLDWQHLLAPAAAPQPAPAPQEEDGAPWQIHIGEFLLNDFSARLTDLSGQPGATVTLDNLDLRLGNIDSAPGSRFDLDLRTRLNQGGDIHVNGQVSALPPSSELKITLRDVSLKPFQPYVSRVARLKLLDGALNLDGKLGYLESASAPDLGFSGRIRIDGFDSRDTLTGERFLAWKQLQLDGLRYEQSPDRLAITTIDSDGLYAKITIAEDGALNVSHVLQAGNGTEKETGEQGEDPAALPVEIGRIRLNDASANFADLSLTPQFATAIHSLRGEIAGLSSATPARADVDIKGKVDKHGSVVISGKINPLSEDKYTDLDVRFGNIELTTFTPYSGKFAGYVIDKGKLSLDLNYQVSRQRLVGQNRIVLNQLTLGEHTGSPDAVSLPIKLAIALMKDANGRIDINLPVEGNLDDPEFRYGHLIGKALLKLVTGIVAAPFRFLGGMLGVDGASLEYAEFAPGSDQLAAAGRDKALKVAEAMKLRPQLDLEIRGSYEETQDSHALKAVKLESRVMMRLGDSGAVNTSPQAAREQIMGILAALYDEQFGKEQRALLEARFVLGPTEEQPRKQRWGRKPPRPQIDQPAYTAALRNQLIEAQPLTQGELRLLAQARAMSLMDAIVTEGNVASQRIYILEPLVDETHPGERKARLTLAARY